MMPDDCLRRLGRYLKEARLEHHLTQDQLAEASAVSKRHITEIEKGRKNASYLILCQLFSVLQIPVGPLFYPEMSQDEISEAKLLAIFRQCSKRDQIFVYRLLAMIADELTHRSEAST